MSWQAHGGVGDVIGVADTAQGHDGGGVVEVLIGEPPRLDRAGGDGMTRMWVAARSRAVVRVKASTAALEVP